MPFLTLKIKCLALLTTVVLLAAPSASVAQSRLALDENGLSGITAATPFSIPSLRRVISGVVWESAERPTEDGAQDIIVATRHGKTGFTVFGDGRGRVAAIEIVSRRVDNRLGPRAGDAYRQVRQEAKLGACWPGKEAQSGRVLCQAAETKRITYVFSGLWTGPDGEMPPASVLNDWTIAQVIWRPDRFAQIGGPQTQTPAFECTKARGSIEQMICRNAELARLDRRLNAVYAGRLTMASQSEQRLLRAEQRGWIKGRNDCWKSSDPHQCVADAYADRIAELDDGGATLRDTTWRGVRIAGDTIPRTIDIHLTFGTDGRITGASGCNRFFARYEPNGHNLRISQIGGTRRMCPEIEMLAERRFLNALEKVGGWAKRNDDLILFGTGAELTFRRM